MALYSKAYSSQILLLSKYLLLTSLQGTNRRNGAREWEAGRDGRADGRTNRGRDGWGMERRTADANRRDGWRHVRGMDGGMDGIYFLNFCAIRSTVSLALYSKAYSSTNFSIRIAYLTSMGGHEFSIAMLL